MTQFEDPQTFAYRCAVAREHLEALRVDLAFHAVAVHAGEDATTWSDIVYDRLGALHRRDVELLVVVALNEQAAEDGGRLWSQIHTMTPEDVR